MFVIGFVLATVLWLGLWFFQTRPAQAAAFEAQKSELQSCLIEKADCSQQRGELQGQNQEVRKKLDEALAGWGRCIRGEKAAQAEP
jgi:hypothetical protein